MKRRMIDEHETAAWVAAFEHWGRWTHIERCQRLAAVFRDIWEQATEAVERELDAARTALSAWHQAFGTTQLDHATERLRVAEAKVEMFRRAIDSGNLIAPPAAEGRTP